MSGVEFTESGSAELEENSTVCDWYDNTAFKWVAAIRSGCGLASVLLSLIIIFIILFYKRFYYFPQRLVLYLALASLLHSLAFSISRVKFGGLRPIQDEYCLFAGFIELYLRWIELLAISLISLNLFTVIVYDEDTSRLEPLLVPLVVFLPLLWCWAPYVNLSFGTHGPWCGIRVHRDDCLPYSSGHYLRFFLWHVPLYTLFLGFFVTSLVAVGIKLSKEAKKWEGARFDPHACRQKQKLIKEVKPRVWYPLIFLILSLPLLISQIYEAIRPNNPRVSIWLLEAIVPPLAGPVIAVVYALDSQTRSILRRLSMKKLCMKYCKKKKKQGVRDYSMDIDSRYGDSVEGDRLRRINYEQHRLAAIALNQMQDLARTTELQLEEVT